MKNQSTALTLITLFMVIILDIMGIILVFPVLTPLLLQTDSAILPINTPLIVRDFLYGFVLAVFPMFMFFSSPVLGDLSDKFGRKKILLVCLLLSAVSYFIAASGIIINSIFLLILGRVLSGIAAGTQPIASAAIIDVSTPETKTRNLSWMVLAVSIGLILGPLLGGITAEKSIMKSFGYETPFFVAGFLSFINAIFLLFTYKESFKPNVNQSVHFLKGFILFFTAFAEKKFRLLSFSFFLGLLSWSLYYQGICWFFMENYKYTVGKLGLFNAYIGVVFVISLTLVSRIVLKLFSKEINAYLFLVLLMAVANIAAALVQSEIGQWSWVILNAIADSIFYTVALSIFSALVDDKAQGWIMGVVGAINAVTWTVGGLVMGPLGYLNIRLPLWSAGVLALFSFLLMLVYRKHIAIKN